MGAYSDNSQEKTVVTFKNNDARNVYAEAWQDVFAEKSGDVKDVSYYNFDDITIDSTGHSIQTLSSAGPIDNEGGTVRELEEEEKGWWESISDWFSNAFSAFFDKLMNTLNFLKKIGTFLIGLGIAIKLIPVLLGFSDEDSKPQNVRQFFGHMIKVDIFKNMNQYLQNKILGNTFNELNNGKGNKFSRAVSRVITFDVFAALNAGAQKIAFGKTFSKMEQEKKEKEKRKRQQKVSGENREKVKENTQGAISKAREKAGVMFKNVVTFDVFEATNNTIQRTIMGEGLSPIARHQSGYKFSEIRSRNKENRINKERERIKEIRADQNLAIKEENSMLNAHYLGGRTSPVEGTYRTSENSSANGLVPTNASMISRQVYSAMTGSGFADLQNSDVLSKDVKDVYSNIKNSVDREFSYKDKSNINEMKYAISDALKSRDEEGFKDELASKLSSIGGEFSSKEFVSNVTKLVEIARDDIAVQSPTGLSIQIDRDKANERSEFDNMMNSEYTKEEFFEQFEVFVDGEEVDLNTFNSDPSALENMAKQGKVNVIKKSDDKTSPEYIPSSIVENISKDEVKDTQNNEEFEQEPPVVQNDREDEEIIVLPKPVEEPSPEEEQTTESGVENREDGEEQRDYTLGDSVSSLVEFIYDVITNVIDKNKTDSEEKAGSESTDSQDYFVGVQEEDIVQVNVDSPDVDDSSHQDVDFKEDNQKEREPSSH